MPELSELSTPNTPNWCPGCGDFGIWAAFKNACVKGGWDNTNTAITAGIGCHGHIVNFVKITSVEGLHGRPIPVACGIKFANHKLNVIAFTGDGDCLAEGGNHLVHAARRNQNITVMLHDNSIYGLTTGQTSPASPKDYKSKSTPAGNPDEPVHPLALAISAGATFVARGYAGDINGLTELMIQAVNHQGFSIVDILQPCQTFNKLYTHAYFQKNTYWIKTPGVNDGTPGVGDTHDSTDKAAAFTKALEWGNEPNTIPLGIFYQVEEPTQESYFPTITGETPLIHQPVQKRDISELLSSFT